MKRKRIVAALLLLGLLLTSACAENDSTPIGTQDVSSPAPLGAYRKISAEEAHQMMRESNVYILLDVRTKEEFKEAHIQGAVLLPDYEIQNKAQIQLPDLDATILVYCRSGRRSMAATQRLIDMGYTNVYDFGGINDWPYATVSSVGKGE